MKTVIVGGGASGMFCAYWCAKNGDDVIIIEKNEKLGKKIYITGKGRCNFTNDCDVQEFLSNVVTNPKFLIGAINSFKPSDTISIFEKNGLKTKVERGNRVFPLSDKSSDVIKTLSYMCEKEGVKVHLNEKVIQVLQKDGAITGVVTEMGSYPCDKAVLCTGGVSYSQTGSTGDGYLFAQKLGHSIVSPRAGLSAIELKDKWVYNLSGLSLKNVKLTAKYNDKVIFSDFGEMLFTHFGISGPIVLSCSSVINKYDIGNIRLFIDLKPALTIEQLDLRLLRDFLKYKGKNIQNVMIDLLPRSLIEPILFLSNINLSKKVDIISKNDRNSILNTLKFLPLYPSRLRDINESIITSGGINVKEINPSTMESKIIKGLFFAGEIIDVDAFTGGFNLQIAFSTGYVAGQSKSKE